MLFNPGVSSCVICSKCPLAERPPGPNTLLLIYEGYPLTQGKPTKEKKRAIYSDFVFGRTSKSSYILSPEGSHLNLRIKKNDYLDCVCGRMQGFTASMFFHVLVGWDQEASISRQQVRKSKFRVCSTTDAFSKNVHRCGAGKWKCTLGHMRITLTGGEFTIWVQLSTFEYFTRKPTLEFRLK